MSKRPNLSLFWSCFSALPLCSSILSPFIRSMPPKLDLKKRCKYVHFCYRWLPWTTWTMYPTSFWWHLHVCGTMLVTFWRIRHDLNSIFYMLATFVYYLFWKCAPRMHRKHNSRWRHKAVLIKNLTFSTSPAPPARVGGSGGGVLFRALTLNK